MRVSTLALLALSAIAVRAQDNDIDDIEQDDIPQQCRDVCLDVVAVYNQCEQEDDNAERDCLCNAQNAANFVPNCEACVAQFDDDGADNDVRDWVQVCGFALATTFTTPMATIMTDTTMTTSSTMPTTTNDDSDDDNNTTSVDPTETMPTTTSTDMPTSTADPGADDGSGDDNADDGGNAAAGLFVPAMSAIGAIMLAAIGIM